mmetsp:Transcript_115487/g.224636  ORF Transcript_115487/g.224636 Transcript_115487/m.224636 type:complete len:186 (+) Transcript_115487:49-606(+)
MITVGGMTLATLPSGSFAAVADLGRACQAFVVSSDCDEDGTASEAARCRPRARSEPESEPGLLFGVSDSEGETVLAPHLKRLRLNEVQSEDSMAVDCAGGDSINAHSSPEDGWKRVGDMLHHSCSSDASWPCSSSASITASRPAASKADIWRAEMQRRALEEMRRYKQEMRIREGCQVLRHCNSL